MSRSWHSRRSARVTSPASTSAAAGQPAAPASASSSSARAISCGARRGCTSDQT